MIQNYRVIHTSRLHASSTADVQCNMYGKLKLAVKVTVSCGLWKVGHASLDTPPPPSPARYPAYCSFPANNRIPQNVTIPCIYDTIRDAILTCARKPT